MLREERESRNLECSGNSTVQHEESKPWEAVGKLEFAGDWKQEWSGTDGAGETLYDAVMVGTRHHVLVQTDTHSIPWATPNVNYVLWHDHDVWV